MDKSERLKYKLGVKEREIKELREELQGKDELIQMLSAFVIEGIEKKGTVTIKRDEIGKGLSSGYHIEVTEEGYVLTAQTK